MRNLIIFPIIFLLALIAGGIFVSKYWKTTVYMQSETLVAEASKFTGGEKAETILNEALIKLAKGRADQVKGLYMSEFAANSQGAVAANIRRNIKNLLEETELDSVVIDVKEIYGPNLPDSLKELIKEFHQKNIWVIARICAFRDASLIEEKPEWYLAEPGSYEFWLDPANPEVQNYIVEFSKEVIDFGFDELQFDYIRFPADYSGEGDRSEVIRGFFLKVSRDLKSYKPSIILSVDLFGYVATQFVASNIGQRLADAADTFDYISFMLYPSHFYGGFAVEEDSKRGLPALSLSPSTVSNHPYEVVSRSIFSAADYLASLDSEAKIRPWLQDFNLAIDTAQGINYGVEEVKAQIKAAQDSGASGWLLWNPLNIYNEEVFK